MHMEDITIIKIGGSVITNKEIPFSTKPEVIKSLCRQIIEFKNNCRQNSMKNHIIIVHGGGSFGHPLAKKYAIQSGWDEKIADQAYGLTKTHQSMERLNSSILNHILNNNVAALTLHTSSCFLKRGGNTQFDAEVQLLSLLRKDIIPILYGDILFHEERDTKAFSILSGDEIIQEICSYLMSIKAPYRIKQIIFCINENGILNGEGEVIPQVNMRQFKGLEYLHNDKSIDVTGGLESKLEHVKNIVNFGIPVRIINGSKENTLYENLMGKKTSGTEIS